MTFSLNKYTMKYQKILLTGAAGGLGKVLRPHLSTLAELARLSDIVPMQEAASGEECVVCDLSNKAAVDALVAGCDAIVHLGGVSVERPFEEVLEANIKGVFHIYEAARRHHVKRVIFASSNHVVGFHEQGQTIDTDCAKRPDGYYGLSKAYGEDLSRFYFDRYGVETVCLRIGSSFAEPKDRRMLVTWLSFADFVHLVRCALTAPEVGHSIIYGMSANKVVWWDNTKAAHIGYSASDSSEIYRAKAEATPALEASDLANRFQGGGFVKAGPFETL